MRRVRPATVLLDDGRQEGRIAGSSERISSSRRNPRSFMVALTIRTAKQATPVVTAGPLAAGCEVAALPGRRRNVRLTGEQVARLLGRYQDEGVSVRELAEEFGIDRSTVLIHVQRAGLPRRNESTFWDEPTLARAVARYEAGALCREIAVEFGVHKSTVARRLQQAGVNMRGR